MVSVLSKYKQKSGNFVGREVTNTAGYTYDVHLGEEPKGGFNKVPYGYVKREIQLMNTATDTIARQKLLTNAGVNEKSVDFFSEATFFRIDECKEFTDISEIENILQRKKLANIKSPIIEGDNARLRKSIKTLHTETQTRNKYYAAVKKIETELYINNYMNSHITYVKVHICTHKNFRSCDETIGASTTEELVDLFKKTYIFSIDYTKDYLKKGDILPQKESLKNSSDFKESILVKEGTNILKTEVFKTRINVLKTLTMALKPTDYAKVKLSHHLPKGIDLLDLYNCESNSASAHTFFIIEATGSTARITNKNNPELKRSVTAPIKLRYELKLSVEFTAKETDYDKVMWITKREENEQFEDVTLWEQFYKTRGEKFSLGYDKIDIDGNNSKAEYMLDIDNQNGLITNTLMNLQSKVADPNLDLDDLERIQKSANIHELVSTNENNQDNEYTIDLDKQPPTLGDLFND